MSCHGSFASFLQPQATLLRHPVLTKSYFFREMAASLVSWCSILTNMRCVKSRDILEVFCGLYVFISVLLEEDNTSDLKSSTNSDTWIPRWLKPEALPWLKHYFYHAKYNVVFSHCTPKIHCAKHLRQSVKTPSLLQKQ